jgi:hypothetical protein
MVEFGISGSVTAVLIGILKSQEAVQSMMRMMTFEAFRPSECSVSFQPLLVNVTQHVTSKDCHVVITTNITMNRVSMRLQRNIENIVKGQQNQPQEDGTVALYANYNQQDAA